MEIRYQEMDAVMHVKLNLDMIVLPLGRHALNNVEMEPLMELKHVMMGMTRAVMDAIAHALLLNQGFSAIQ